MFKTAMTNQSGVSVLEELKAWKYVEEEVLLCKTTYGKNNVDILEVKIKELQNWKDHDVFTEIPDDGQKRITVLTSNLSFYKVRRLKEMSTLNLQRRQAPISYGN